MSLSGDIHLYVFLYYTRQGTGRGECLVVRTFTYSYFYTKLDRGQVWVDVILWGHPPTPVSALYYAGDRYRWMSSYANIHLHLFLYYIRQGTDIGGSLLMGTSTYTCFYATLHRGQV